MSNNANRFSSVLITGASRGLGRALALQYAHPNTKLWLSATRNEKALHETAELCRKRGSANVHTKLINVTDENAMKEWVENCFAIQPLDLIIANAGISGGTHNAENENSADVQPFENYGQAMQIFDVNLNGVLNTIHPAIEKIIASNKERMGKSLWTEQSGGEKIKIISVWDDKEEARYVGDEITSLQQIKKHSLNDIAILVRAGFQTRYNGSAPQRSEC